MILLYVVIDKSLKHYVMTTL